MAVAAASREYDRAVDSKGAFDPKGTDSDTSYDKVHEEDYRVVSGRRKKRKYREGSSTVEEISTKRDSMSNSTDSETDYDNYENVFRTPKANPPDLKVFITPIERSKSLRNISLLVIAKSIQNVSGSPPEFMKSMNAGILVKCRNEKQLRQISDIQQIGNVPVKTQKHQSAKGVISGVPIEMGEEEIKSELKRQKVINVKRITRKTYNQEKKDTLYTPTRSVILTFDSKQIPEEVILCFQSFNVKQWIPPVVRCFKCQRHGHTAANCRSKTRCVRCGESHCFEECPRKENPKCVNCGDDHSAAYNGCKMIKRAKEIQKLKTVHSLSYAEAARTYRAKEEQTKEKTQKTPLPNRVSYASAATMATNSGNLPVAGAEGLARTKPQKQTAPRILPSLPSSTVSQAVETISNLMVGTDRKTDTNKGKAVESQTSNSTTDKTEQKGNPPGSNFLVNASNEEIISFVVKIVLIFVSEQTEPEILALIRSLVEQVLIERSKCSS